MNNIGRKPRKKSPDLENVCDVSEARVPGHRYAMGAKGKVMIEGWAIVDNTSGEDWKDVMVGVGSSSALSFHYDLWSVRSVQRATLATEDKFAVAPPTAVSPYGGAGRSAEPEILAELEDGEIRRPPGHPDDSETIPSSAALPTKEGKRKASSVARGGLSAEEGGDWDGSAGRFDGGCGKLSRRRTVLTVDYRPLAVRPGLLTMTPACRGAQWKHKKGLRSLLYVKRDPLNLIGVIPA